MTRLRLASLAVVLLFAIGSATALPRIAPMPKQILMPSFPYPLWIAADALFDGSNKLDLQRMQVLHPASTRAIFDLLVKDEQAGGCHLVQEVYTNDLDTPNYENLENARAAAFIVSGRVTGLLFGFAASVPGTLARIDDARVVRGRSRESTFYFFVPIADFQLAGQRICKVDSRYAGLPTLGDRVFLFSNPPLAEIPQYLLVKSPTSMILVRDTRVLYPSAFHSRPDTTGVEVPPTVQLFYDSLGFAEDGTR